MWELDYKESWVSKNWCFGTVVLEKSPRIARRSNQSILKEISPGCSLEGLMLKLKLQYFGHLMRRADLFEKALMLGKIEGRRRGWDGWMASLIQWTWAWINSGSWWWTGRPGVLQSMRSQRVGHDWVTELNWSSYIYWGWKPHDLLSVSWTLQREPVMRVSQSRDTRVWMSEGRRRWMSQLKQGQQIHPSSVLLIHSGSQGIGWCLPHIEDHLF